MIEGQCLCGQIAFEIDASKIALFSICYCENCQRDSGAGFVSQLQVQKDGFSWIQGEGSDEFWTAFMKAKQDGT